MHDSTAHRTHSIGWSVEVHLLYTNTRRVTTPSRGLGDDDLTRKIDSDVRAIASLERLLQTEDTTSAPINGVSYPSPPRQRFVGNRARTSQVSETRKLPEGNECAFCVFAQDLKMAMLLCRDVVGVEVLE
jgi:hypothetical protein